MTSAKKSRRLATSLNRSLTTDCDLLQVTSIKGHDLVTSVKCGLLVTSVKCISFVISSRYSRLWPRVRWIRNFGENSKFRELL
jgi:hypothetical protein